MLIIQSDLIKNTCCNKYVHNSGPTRSPDMILIAFYLKFCAWKDGIPPEAWNPQTKAPKPKTNTTQHRHPRTTARTPLVRQGAAAPREPLCVAYLLPSTIVRRVDGLQNGPYRSDIQVGHVFRGAPWRACGYYQVAVGSAWGWGTS